MLKTNNKAVATPPKYKRPNKEKDGMRMFKEEVEKMSNELMALLQDLKALGLNDRQRAQIITYNFKLIREQLKAMQGA